MRQQPEADRPGPGQLRVGASRSSRRPTSATPRAVGSAFGVSYPDGNINTLPGFAWGTLILPYLEQAPVYASFNINLPCWAPDNTTSARTKLSVFLCPSATGGSDGFALHRYTNGNAQSPDDGGPFTPEITFAHSHYVTNAGVNQPWGGRTAYSCDFDVPEPVPGAPAPTSSTARSTATRGRGWPT